MNELALFAGAGGGILGGHLLGWRTVAAVEIEDYPRRVLLQRQADGFLPRFPIWDDICTFDGKPWRGKVDVISGGFPCQDISIAGGGEDLMEKDQDYGAKWRELLARYNPLTHSWRTLQCSLFEDLELSLETFPRWGMTVGGELFQLQTLVQTTSVNESGLWPTPTTPSGGGNCGGSGAYKNALKNGTHIPHSINPNLYEWLMGWPLGWTDLKPLEMDKSHFVQQQHGES